MVDRKENYIFDLGVKGLINGMNFGITVAVISK